MSTPDTAGHAALLGAAMAGPSSIHVMPIADRLGNVHVVEALARYDAGNPHEVFAAAAAAGLRVPAELAAARAAVAELAHVPADVRLSINLSSESLGSWDSYEILSPVAPRLWVEVTEVTPVVEDSLALTVLAQLRRDGAVIVVDDAGAEFADTTMIALVEPDVVKLDMHLVRQALAGDTARAAELAAIVACSQRLGAELVAEGIEPDTDLDGLLADVALLQGFGVGRPMATAALFA